MACLAVLLVVLSLSDAAITNTPQSVSACNGRYVNLKWTFDTANFFAAEWKINGSLMLQYAPIGNPQLNYYNGYTNATLIHVTNGEINITSLTTSNSGNYSCTVTYSSGSPLSFETQMMLTVYDMISTNLSCSYNQSVGKIDCSVIPVSILSVTVNGAVHSTSSLPISVTAGSAKYTVCMTGDAAECRNDGILPCVSIEGQSPTSQRNPSLATEKTTSVNNISELSNITVSMITGSITPSIDILASTSSYFNNRTTNLYVHTEPTEFYLKTEITTVSTIIKTTEIETESSGIISNAISTYQSNFLTTATNDISGSFDTYSQHITETFALPDYSYNEITVPSAFKTRNFFLQTLTETPISLSVNTPSDTLSHTFHAGSVSMFINDSSKYSIFAITVSPPSIGDSFIASLSNILSVPSFTTISTYSAFEIKNVSRVNSFSLAIETGQIPIITATVDFSGNSEKSNILLLSISGNNSNSYTSKLEDQSLSSYQNLTETIMTLSSNNFINGLQSSIFDTMERFLKTTQILNISNQDDTYMSIDDLTVGFQTFSQDSVSSVSTPYGKLSSTIIPQLSFPTTEYQATMQTKFKSYVTTSFNDPNTDNGNEQVYSSEIESSTKSYMFTNAMPSETKLRSMNDINGSTTYLLLNTLESYSTIKNVVFPSKMSEYVLSTLQSTTSVLPFNTNANATVDNSFMKKTNLMIVETQSGMLTTSAVLSDIEASKLKTSMNFNNDSIVSIIKPSSQQTKIDNSYVEIDTSFKNLMLSPSSFTESTQNYLDMTTLLFGVFESISTTPTSTTQSGLSEKNKTTIFISTTAAVVTIIVVIFVIIFARMSMLKHNMKLHIEGDNISWSNSSSLEETALHEYTFTGKNRYNMFNTSVTSFKMHPYEHNWNDTV